MFESVTFESILARMLDRVPDKFDKREGSIIYDALAPAAVELQLLYLELDAIIAEAFGDTASRTYLIRRCSERGITPYKASNAILKGVFTPSDIDVLGSRFSAADSSDNLNYVAAEKIANGEYRLKCETVGTAGNRFLGQLVPIDYVDGLETAELAEVLIPAEDDEETEALRQRYFNSFEIKAFGGNVQDYIEKTLGIAGVGAVKVTPVWNGGGTVLLTILDSIFLPAKPALLDFVKATIDPLESQGTGSGLAPIGHTVTVKAAAAVTVNITANIAFDTGYSWANLQDEITNAAADYLLSLRRDWASTDSVTVRISHLESRFLGIAGVADVTATKLNGSADNLSLGEYQVPVLGGVFGDQTM